MEFCADDHNNINIDYSLAIHNLNVEKKVNIKNVPKKRMKNLTKNSINNVHLPKNICRDNKKIDVYKSIYQKLHNTIIYYENNNILISSAKFLIDDTLLVNEDVCLKLYENNVEKASFNHTGISIYYIDDSQNSEFIIGYGQSCMNLRKISCIWKYNMSQDSCEISQHTDYEYEDLYLTKFSHDNKLIF
ncbi:hypothetical protein HZS_5367, partial [Henneguya salminicola]